MLKDDVERAMPMLRITADDDTPRLHGAATPLLPVLRHALASDPGPVTIMVHGFKYAPGVAGRCPHASIFARDVTPVRGREISWPRHLGLRGQRGEGLGISFGWPAHCSIWQAHARAEQAGVALARMVTMIRDLSPRRPVHVVAHSLGARVALAAVRAGQPGAITRTILLAAAEYGETARAALSSDAGRQTQVLNVTSRENDLFDFLMERAVASHHPGDRMLGHFPTHLPNMVTLQLDDPEALAALRRAGYPIAPPERRVCHWSPYLRAGVFPLYCAFLSGEMPLPVLRAALPEAPAPRWSRLLPLRALPASRASRDAPHGVTQA